MVLSSAVAGISVALQGLVGSSLVALGITYALLVDVVSCFCWLYSHSLLLIVLMLMSRRYTMDNTNVAGAVSGCKSWSLTKADEDCVSGFEICLELTFL